MSKIYIVKSCSGEYEDYVEANVKAFADVHRAEELITILEEEEQVNRKNAKRCRECGGINLECPFYIEPAWEDMGCQNYNPWHDDTHYIIDEVEYDEKKNKDTP